MTFGEFVLYRSLMREAATPRQKIRLRELAAKADEGDERARLAFRRMMTRLFNRYCQQG